MPVYEFSLVLKTSQLDEEGCDALYEAGCDDGTIVTRNGVTHIAFDREGASLEDAVRSATRDVQAAGFDIERIEMKVLV